MNLDSGLLRWSPKKLLRTFFFCCLSLALFAAAALPTDEKKVVPKKPERQFPSVEMFVNNHKYGKKNGCSRLMEEKGRMVCGLKPNVSEVTWFYFASGPTGDTYLFFRKFPIGQKDAKGSSTNVVYSGKEVVVWKDDFQQLILRPPTAAKETNSIAPEKK